VRRQIRATLLHEVGHYFGLSEEELRGARPRAVARRRPHTNMSQAAESRNQRLCATSSFNQA
jgi:hypothetical protein